MLRSGPDRHAYNLGKYRNFCEVFGDNKLVWFLPVYSRYILFLYHSFVFFCPSLFICRTSRSMRLLYSSSPCSFSSLSHGDGIVYTTRAHSNQHPQEQQSQTPQQSQSFYNSIGQSDSVTVPIESAPPDRLEDKVPNNVVEV